MSDHVEGLDDESIGRQRRRREAQSIHGPVWGWLHQVQAAMTYNRGDFNNAVNQALDVVSNGSAAFSSLSSSTQLSSESSSARLDSHHTFHTAPNSQPSPGRYSGDTAAEPLPGFERPAARTWDYVDEHNARVMASRDHQGARTTYRPQPERNAQHTMGGDVWQQWLTPWVPTTGMAGLFPPPTPQTPAPNPIRQTVTAGGVQQASPVEVFPPPHSEAPIPDPVKSQATARESPFRPSRTIRRVGNLVSRDRMPVRGIPRGNKELPDLGGYEFVLEQAGLDK